MSVGSNTIQGFDNRFHKKIDIIVKISAIYRWKIDISAIVSTACRACGDALAATFRSHYIVDLSACFRIYRQYFGQNIDEISMLGGGDQSALT